MVAVDRVNVSIETSDELWVVVDPHANEAGQAAVVVMLDVTRGAVVAVEVKQTGRIAATEGTHVAEA